MILFKTAKPSVRKAHFEEALNDESLAFELDMMNEVRDHTQIQKEASKRRTTWKHEARLKRREF